MLKTDEVIAELGQRIRELYPTGEAVNDPAAQLRYFQFICQCFPAAFRDYGQTDHCQRAGAELAATPTPLAAAIIIRSMAAEVVRGSILGEAAMYIKREQAEQ